MATTATDCAIIGTINGKTIETPARTLREHVTALEDAARRWFPGTGETLRIHPMPLTAETVAAYAELVMSAGGVFEIENLEVVVA